MDMGERSGSIFFSQICALVLLLFQISRLCVLGCLHCDLSRASPYTGRDNRSGCRTLISINFEITGSVSLVSPSTMLVIPFDVLHCNWNQLSDSMLKMVLCHGVQQGK